MRVLLILFPVVLGVMLAGAIILSATKSPGAPPPVAVPVLLALTVGVSALCAWRYDVSRRAELVKGLKAQGFTVSLGKEDAPEAQHYRPAKRHHSYKVFFSAVGTLHARAALISEYRFATGHGKGRREHPRTEVAVDVPEGSPSIALVAKKGIFGTPIGDFFSPPVSPVEDQAFNKRWAVESEDMASATRLLTPRFVAFLTAAPRKEVQWVVAGGWLSCTWAVKPKQMDIEMIFVRLDQAAMLVEHASREGAARA